MLTSKPSKVAKVVICGMKSVGKTAILEQLIYGNITPDTVNTHTSLKTDDQHSPLNDVIGENNVFGFSFPGIAFNHRRYICGER